MSLDNIFNKINEDAQKDINKLNKKTQEEIAEFNEKTNKENAVIQSKLNNKVEKERERYLYNIKDEAASGAKNEILKKKQELLDKFYKKVINEIIELPPEDYLKFLVSLLEKLPKINDGLILCSGKDKEHIKKALGKTKMVYKLSDENIKSSGGFILRAKDVEIDNTLEAIVRQLRDDTMIEVGKILFGE